MRRVFLSSRACLDAVLIAQRMQLHAALTLLHRERMQLHALLTQLHWELTQLHALSTQLRWELTQLHQELTLLHQERGQHPYRTARKAICPHQA